MQEFARKYSLNNKKRRRELYMRKVKKKNAAIISNYIEGKIGMKNTINFWSNYSLVKKFFDSAARVLYINEPSDWYRISNRQIIKCGGRGMFRTYRTLGDALNFVYPEEKFEVSKFRLRGRKSTQRWLLVQMKVLLPNEIILEDYYHQNLLWDTGLYVQLDVFVPRINLAVEYQGEQHFKEFKWQGSGSSLEEVIERDKRKIQICNENGITLVTVPYWWDRKPDSLSSTLAQYFPNEFSITDSLPIPISLPPDFHGNKGQLMYC